MCGFFIALLCGLPSLELEGMAQGQVPSSPADQARVRQQQVKSVDLRFKQTEIIAPGGISTSFAEFSKKGIPVPANETTLTSTNRVAIQDSCFRYEDHHPIWQLPGGQLLKRETVALFTGVMPKKYYPNGDNGNGTGQGILERAGKQRRTDEAILVPIMLTFRGIDPTFSPYSYNAMKPTQVRLPIEGVDCERFDLALTPKLMVEFWLDKRGLPFRISQRQVGKLTEQLDIQYEPNEVCNAVPKAWTRKKFSAEGSVLRQVSVEVNEIVVNTQLPASEFDILFPAGWHVYDQRTGKSYRAQPNGILRELSPNGDETGVTMLQPGVSHYSQYRVYWIGAAVLVALLVSYFALRKLTRLRERSVGSSPNTGSS